VQYNLGYCYFFKNDTRYYAKAVYWFTKLAEQGNVSAQCELGLCYYYGLGVPKDNEKSVYWYTKSAEQGNDIAQSKLGHLYNKKD